MHPLGTVNGAVGLYGSHAYVVVYNGVDLYIFEADNPRGILVGTMHYYNSQQDPTGYNNFKREVFAEAGMRGSYFILGLEKQNPATKSYDAFVKPFMQTSSAVTAAHVDYWPLGNESDSPYSSGGYNSNNFAWTLLENHNIHAPAKVPVNVPGWGHDICSITWYLPACGFQPTITTKG